MPQNQCERADLQLPNVGSASDLDLSSLAAWQLAGKVSIITKVSQLVTNITSHSSLGLVKYLLL